MKTGSQMLMDRIASVEEARSHEQPRHKGVDVMVAALGLTVAFAGFFSHEVTWLFVGS